MTGEDPSQLRSAALVSREQRSTGADTGTPGGDEARLVERTPTGTRPQPITTDELAPHTWAIQAYGGAMTSGEMYHDGSRRLQDRFDSRRIADRLEQVTLHSTFTADDREFIDRCSMFFLATADTDGWPDCSYKGGQPGFVQVLDDHTLAFPSYDGNGMFRSLGNLLVNPKVGLLFIDFERPNRMRVNGIASLHDDAELLEAFEGAQLVVRVRAERIFPNCPRYIHKMALVEHSVFSPRPGHVPPVPDWKQMDVFRDYLPGTQGESTR